jgi:hypothetical protein
MDPYDPSLDIEAPDEFSTFSRYSFRESSRQPRAIRLRLGIARQPSVESISEPAFLEAVPAPEPIAAAVPAAAAPLLDWVEFSLGEQSGEALAGKPFRIELTDGSTREGRLDERGRARFDEIPSGVCTVYFDADSDLSAIAPSAGVTTPVAATADWIEVTLQDESGQSLAGNAFRIELADGSFRDGKLDDGGRVRLEGIPNGSCKVFFPELNVPAPA